MADRFCVPIRGNLVQGTKSARPSIPLELSAPPFRDGPLDLSIFSWTPDADANRTHSQASVGALVLGVARHRMTALGVDLVESSRADGKIGQPNRRSFGKAIDAGAPKSLSPDCAEIARTPATDCHAPVTPQVYVAAVRLLGAWAAVQKAEFHKLGGPALSVTGVPWTEYSRTALARSAKSARRRGSLFMSVSAIETAHA